MSHKTFSDLSDELLAMRAGIDYRIPVKIRGFKIMLRPLSMLETQQVAATVKEKMEEAPESWRNSLTESAIRAKETIKLASTSKPGAGDFKIHDVTLDEMTADEALFLYKQYLAVCDKANPALERMPSKDLQALVEAIRAPFAVDPSKKNDPVAQEELVSALTELSFTQLVNVCLHMTLCD